MEPREGEEVFHVRVHFDAHTLDADVSAADKPGAELRVREGLAQDPAMKGIAQVWGEPGRVEVWTLDEYVVDPGEDPA